LLVDGFSDTIEGKRREKKRCIAWKLDIHTKTAEKIYFIVLLTTIANPKQNQVEKKKIDRKIFRQFCIITPQTRTKTAKLILL
jgi:hypothetical protein